MKIGTPVLFFKIPEVGTPCEPHFAIVVDRPKSFPTLNVQSMDSGGSESLQINVPQAGSLQECIEIGNRWITFEQAESWGIDLEDGDQVIEGIVVP